MTADERIATLILHGCVMLRHPEAPNMYSEWRCILPRLPGVRPLALVRRVRSQPHKGMRWLYVGISISRTDIEIPFDTRLIETIPEELFAHYLNLLGENS